MKFTKEQIEFLKDNINKYTKPELVIMLKEKFDLEITRTNLQSWCGKLGIKPTKQYQFHHNRFTSPEQREWLIQNYGKFDGFYNRLTLLTDEFNKQFNTNLTKDQIGTKLDTLKIAKSNKFTEEEKNWLKENVNNYDMHTLTKLFNETFNSNRKVNSIQVATTTYGYRVAWKMDKKTLTQEEKEWIKKHYNDEDNNTLYLKFNEKFNRDLTCIAFTARCKKMRIKKQYRIEEETTKKVYKYIYENIDKYIIDNKIDYDIIEKDIEENFGDYKINRHNVLGFLRKKMNVKDLLRQESSPIGYEYQREGLWYVKVSNVKNATQYENSMLKNRYMYEKYYNCKLTDDDVIIHLDNDKNNFEKENLIRLTKKENGILIGNKFNNLEDTELKKVAILYSKIQAKTKEREQNGI